eukprot:CAMPEP_0171394382 /NCGR_PEP_ID=MMETSP0880-20121228/3289_1 /TAXON_ID=67004 /ORGANISM="Thalassiosira weissflogii, Strain CCMP1336" /LENGTH=200 /DNA_ID=CAMNT_0011907717 /DNA_START=747 /DNA_END=1351 /DNA_ORIENTATION=-
MTATFPYRRLGDVLRSLWWMAWAAGDQMALPRPMEETTRIMAHDLTPPITNGKTPKVHDIISLLLTTLSKTSPSLSFIKLLCTNKLYDLSSSTKSSPTKSYLSSPSLVDVDSQAIYDKQAMEGVGEGVDIVEIAPRMRHSTTSSAENLDLVSLIEHFDSMKFLCAHREKFPSICMLARSLKADSQTMDSKRGFFQLQGMQ